MQIRVQLENFTLRPCDLIKTNYLKWRLMRLRTILIFNSYEKIYYNIMYFHLCSYIFIIILLCFEYIYFYFGIYSNRFES